MFNIGPWELGLILLVALIVVGPGKLPEVAKSIGQGINEFKKVTNGYKKEFQEAMNSIDTPASPQSKEVPVIVEGASIAEMADKFDAVVVNQEVQEVHGDAPAESAPCEEVIPSPQDVTKQ
jgi:TatA/E family protein of Tat protein translocase